MSKSKKSVIKANKKKRYNKMKNRKVEILEPIIYEPKLIAEAKRMIIDKTESFEDKVTYIEY